MRGGVSVMQREVEFHHIDHGFTDESQQGFCRVLPDQLVQCYDTDTTSLRNARDLIERRRDADIRVKPARRGSNEVHRDRSFFRRISGLDGLDPRRHMLCQNRIVRTQIGGTRPRPIVWYR